MGPTAACSTTAVAASGRRAPCCPTSAWWCSERPTATSAEGVLTEHGLGDRLAHRPMARRWKYHPLGRAGWTTISVPVPMPVSDSGQTASSVKGSKNGTYYSLESGHGHPRWSTNVVFGGVGRLLGTHGLRRWSTSGCTGLGDFLPTSERRAPPLRPGRSPGRRAARIRPTTPSTRHRNSAVAAATTPPTFSATTVAGGMTFDGRRWPPRHRRANAPTDDLLTQVVLPQFNWSGVATWAMPWSSASGPRRRRARRGSRC